MLVHDVIGKYKTKMAVNQPNRARTRFIVVHHAAYTYKPGTACQAIFTYHSSKWPKYGRIGYQEVIQEEPDGSLACYIVNEPELQGANVGDRNHEVFGICAATNFTALPGQNWFETLAERAAAAKRRWPDAEIVGHKDIALPAWPTACPGPRWSEWKSAFLTHVQSLLQTGPVAPAAPDYTALWGSIATPNGQAWEWDTTRLWKENAKWLGKCVALPVYPVGSRLVVLFFQGGMIWQKDTAAPELVRFPKAFS